jgi:hypothetical protein
MSKHFKKGDNVFVHTRHLAPQVTGIYRISKYAWWSNYPYRIMYEGVEMLLQWDEVASVWHYGALR